MISHLDDEQVSAALDGEASADERAHLETCETCRARLDAFRTVSQAVAEPVPSDLIARETAVAAAMAPEMPRRRPPVATWLAAAAAAVIALAVAVPLLSSSSSKKSTSTALSSSATSSVAKGSVSGTPTALGNQTDPTALAAVVRERLGSEQSAAAASKSAAPAAGGFQNSDTSQSTAPAVPCANEAAAAVSHSAAELRYEATLTWKGRLAVVMVFGSDPHPAAVVIAQTTCEVLARLPL
jgi:hypothetical protein